MSDKVCRWQRFAVLLQSHRVLSVAQCRNFRLCVCSLDEFLGGSRDPSRPDVKDQSRGAESLHTHCQGTHKPAQSDIDDDPS